jgi:hypothetical protein
MTRTSKLILAVVGAIIAFWVLAVLALLLASPSG